MYQLNSISSGKYILIVMESLGRKKGELFYGFKNVPNNLYREYFLKHSKFTRTVLNSVIKFRQIRCLLIKGKYFYKYLFIFHSMYAERR